MSRIEKGLILVAAVVLVSAVWPEDREDSRCVDVSELLCVTSIFGSMCVANVTAPTGDIVETYLDEYPDSDTGLVVERKCQDYFFFERCNDWVAIDQCKLIEV